MTSVLFAGLTGSAEDQTGGQRWRDTMRVLWQYGRRDMRDALEQEKRLYTKNWQNHVLRPVPFVWALARELATAYIQEPSRTWTGLDGKPLSAELQKLIADEYRRARVNRVMRNAHRQLVHLNNATVWVRPNTTNSGCVLRLIPPHEQEVLQRPFALSEDEVEWWRFRIALPQAPDPQMMQWAIARVSTTEAYWEQGPSGLVGRGLYMTDKSNPWGMIPVAMLRGSEPGEGEWWAPAPEDILASQRAMTHDLTDVGTIARLQGFGQPVWKGGSTKDHEQPLGPETAVAVPSDGDFDFAQADPRLEGYVEQLKEYATAVIGMNGLSPATFTKSTGITAVAKQMELIDRESYRKEHMEILRGAEQRIYDIMRAQMNWMRGGVEIWPPANVQVEYREPVLPVDPLHDMQALEIAIRLHQTSEARARALRDGTSVEEAQMRIDQEKGKAPTPAGDQPADRESVEAARESAGSPPALEAEGEVQKAALNGAQVAEMRGTIQAVADGQLPAASARAIILAAYPIAPADVDAMLSPLEGFVAKPKAGPPSASPEPENADGADDPDAEQEAA